MTSDFSTCPRLPLPATSSTAMFFSASSLAADGAGGMDRGSTAPASPAIFSVFSAASCMEAAPALPEACATASGFAAPLPPALKDASSPPTAMVSPSLATISASTPSEGAGTSTDTLSVSSSTSGSSAFTASPGFLSQRPTVASETDSPSVGTRISVAIDPVSFLCFRIAGRQPPSESSRNACNCSRCRDMRPVAGEAAAGRPAYRGRRCLAPIWSNTHSR